MSEMNVTSLDTLTGHCETSEIAEEIALFQQVVAEEGGRYL